MSNRGWLLYFGLLIYGVAISPNADESFGESLVQGVLIGLGAYIIARVVTYERNGRSNR